MTIGIISHPECELHEGQLGHPERPDRVRVIQKAIESFPFSKKVNYYAAPLADRSQLLSIHDETYVDWIFSISPAADIIYIDEDTAMNPHTLQAALRAAGSVQYAVDLVMQKKETVVFCNVRPPGHHAEHDKAMGFCFFNNIALGVMHALNQYDLKRIAIVDFDVHRGNGTQDIFQNDARVLYCSSFQSPFYPGYDEEMDNQHILSVPLNPDMSSEDFRQAVQLAWFDKLAAFEPQLIFFSAGFDAHVNDPLANISLTKEDYVWLTMHIAKIAKVHCEGRMISVLEGGYNLDVLQECVPAHIQAMLV